MLLLHTDSLYRYGLHRVFGIAKKAGYDGIELGISPANLDTQNAKYLKELVDATGVRIYVVQTEVEATVEKIEMAYKVAKEVEAGTIVLQPPSYFDYATIKWLKNNMGALRDKDGLRVPVLNVADKRQFGVIPKYAFSNPQDLREFKQIALDVSNLVSRGVPVLDYYEKMKNYIFHVHLSNYRGEKSHCLPSQGRVPLESLLKKMKQRDYTGHFSLKVNPTELRMGKEDSRVLDALKEAKDFFEEYFKN